MRLTKLFLTMCLRLIFILSVILTYSRQSFAVIVLNESQTEYLCSQLEGLKSLGVIDDSVDSIPSYVVYMTSSNEKAEETRRVNSEQLVQVIGEMAYQFATCYSVSDSLDTLKRWLRLAIDYGHVEAELGLARLTLLYGEDGKEEKQAADLLGKRLSDGIEYESLVMAVAYFNGLGVTRDLDLALVKLKIAANFGHTMAQHLLAHIYENGLFNQKVDREKALFWLNFTPKNYDAAFECSIKAFVEYGVIDKSDVEAELIEECERIKAKKD